MGLHVHGLHMHTGSDILDIDAFMRGADLLLDLAHDFKELTYIDFGSETECRQSKCHSRDGFLLH